MQEAIKAMKGKKLAFVCSGGVIKAASWHFGVALALSELGFEFKSNTNLESDYHISTFVGSSAGTLVSILLACGLHPEEIINTTIKGQHNKRFPRVGYKDIFSFSRPKEFNQGPHYDPLKDLPFWIRTPLRPFTKISGLFSTVGLKNYLDNHILDNATFESLKADLFIVATQLDHSQKIIFSKYNYPSPTEDISTKYFTGVPVAQAAAASMSVPPFFSPYPLYNPTKKRVDYYIDGEVRDTLSTHVAIDNKCDYVISSWTHTPYHYHKEIGSLVNYGIPSICIQAIYLMIQKKIISARSRRATANDIISAVNDYFLKEKISDKHRIKVMAILERKLGHQRPYKLIDIYPKHQNYKFFFSNFFSLSSETLSTAVKLGYRRTLEVFKELDLSS